MVCIDRLKHHLYIRGKGTNILLRTIAQEKIFSGQSQVWRWASYMATHSHRPPRGLPPEDHAKQNNPNPDDLSKCPYLRNRGSKSAAKTSLGLVVSGPLRWCKEKATIIIQSLPIGFHCSTFTRYWTHSTISNSMKKHMETQRKSKSIEDGKINQPRFWMNTTVSGDRSREMIFVIIAMLLSSGFCTLKESSKGMRHFMMNTRNSSLIPQRIHWGSATGEAKAWRWVPPQERKAQ